MPKKIEFWTLFISACCVLALSVVNLVLYISNHQNQLQVSSRQKLLIESAKFEQLSNNLIKGLANTAAATGDEELKLMLTRNGVTYTLQDDTEPGLGDASRE